MRSGTSCVLSKTFEYPTGDDTDDTTEEGRELKCRSQFTTCNHYQGRPSLRDPFATETHKGGIGPSTREAEFRVVPIVTESDPRGPSAGAPVLHSRSPNEPFTWVLRVYPLTPSLRTSPSVVVFHSLMGQSVPGDLNR